MPFFLFSILLSAALICGMLSGCNPGQKAQDTEASVLNNDDESAVTDSVSESAPAPSGADSTETHGENAFEPGTDPESSPIPTVSDADANGTESESEEPGNNATPTDFPKDVAADEEESEDNTDSAVGESPSDQTEESGGGSLQAEFPVEDWTNYENQIMTSIEETTRLISAQKQDIANLKMAVDRGFRIIAILIIVSLVVIITGIVIFASKINKFTDENDENIDDVAENIRTIQQLQKKELSEIQELKAKNTALKQEISDLKKLAFSKTEQGAVDNYGSQNQNAEVYFKVSQFSKDTQDRMPRLEKADSMTMQFIIGSPEDEQGRRYSLLPVIDSFNRIQIDVLYSADMKDCFKIEPSSSTSLHKSSTDRLCTIASWQPATIELENGDEYKLSEKGYIKVI